MFKFSSPPPLSLYIHFPWCERKCPYCDFNSHSLKNPLPESAYIDALLKDLEQELPSVWGRTVQSIFMGGGTPSLFSGQAIDRLLSGIRARLPLQPNLEITLEANPGSVEQRRFSAYRAAGVNRLSIGVQSFNDFHLNALGRIHDARHATQAVRAAQLAGFDDINLDLMFGLPHQHLDQALDDVRAGLALQPTHLSWYQLNLEPNTPFYAAPPTLPNDDVTWHMQCQGQSLLSEFGYTQYEVSAYSKPGKSCRHNLNYWRFGDYIGIGAGAHGKITDSAQGAIHRRWKKRHPKEYMETAGSVHNIGGQNRVSEAEAIFEYALNRLRLKAPFSLAEFEASCGLQRRWIIERIQQAQSEGFLTLQGETVQHTPSGWQFLNDLLERFLPEETHRVRSGLD